MLNQNLNDPASEILCADDFIKTVDDEIDLDQCVTNPDQFVKYCSNEDRSLLIHAGQGSQSNTNLVSGQTVPKCTNQNDPTKSEKNSITASFGDPASGSEKRRSNRVHWFIIFLF